jgi:hypothetical protein
VYFTPDAPSGLTATSIVPFTIDFSWTPPDLMPVGAVYELYEYSSSTPFASASKVWEGIATSCRLYKDDFTTRYYWVRVRMPDGTYGTEHPTSSAGVAGAAGSVTVVGTSSVSSAHADDSGAVVNITSLSVTNPDQTNARKVVVSVNGAWSITSATLPIGADLRLAIETSNASIGSNYLDVIDDLSSGTQHGGPFSIERTFSLAAGATQVYYFNVQQASPIIISGTTIEFQLKNSEMKYELMVR